MALPPRQISPPAMAAAAHKQARETGAATPPIHKRLDKAPGYMIGVTVAGIANASAEEVHRFFATPEEHPGVLKCCLGVRDVERKELGVGVTEATYKIRFAVNALGMRMALGMRQRHRADNNRLQCHISQAGKTALMSRMDVLYAAIPLEGEDAELEGAELDQEVARTVQELLSSVGALQRSPKRAPPPPLPLPRAQPAIRSSSLSDDGSSDGELSSAGDCGTVRSASMASMPSMATVPSTASMASMPSASISRASSEASSSGSGPVLGALQSFNIWAQQQITRRSPQPARPPRCIVITHSKLKPRMCAPGMKKVLIGQMMNDCTKNLQDALAKFNGGTAGSAK